MYYEINVSYRNTHYFATAERSIKCLYELEPILKHFKELFKEDDGYKISVTYWEKVGKRLDIETLEEYKKPKKNI